MSVSKLESLPNEILVDLFERYINGIDIIKAFRFQLNRRFDSLIKQCQRFNFNFINCHKNDFCFSIGLLPAYIDRIEQLALSDQNAPGQIHAFLASSSSFISFKQLRKLYMNVNVDAVEETILILALQSLRTTSLHTLSIVINETNTLTSFDSNIMELFRIESLKKLLIISKTEVGRISWEPLSNYCSNIEHLTVKGISCDFDNVFHIFRCASGLKYLDLTIQANQYIRWKKVKITTEQQFIQMSKLHTMIMTITGDTTSIQSSVNSIFQCVPSLQRLDVTINESSFDITIWESLIKDRLSKLIYFTLQCISYHLNDDDAKNIIDAIQIPFWTERKHFNIVLKKYQYGVDDQHYLNNVENVSIDNSHVFVEEWYILPQRQQQQQQNVRFYHPTNQIKNLTISSKSNSLTQDYYLNNVENLLIYEMNDNLLELLTSHIDLFQIKHLDISSIRNPNKYLLSVLIKMTNLRSLHINGDQLNLLQSTPLTNHYQLKFIDFYIGRRDFREAHAKTLSKIFPYTEHLCIDRINLQDIPSLNSYFPKLRSFTFTTRQTQGMNITDNYEKKMYDVKLRRKAKFLFYRKEKWLTVWLDEAAYREDVWTNHAAM